MRTPRPTTRRTTTLIGNAWLREVPVNPSPRGWEIRSRSSLRKCMFLPIPPGARAFEAKVGAGALLSRSPDKPPSPSPNKPPNLTPHRRRPDHDVRVFAAVSPEEIYARTRVEAQAKLLARPAAVSYPPRWYEDPVALGSLLLVLPPIGLTALWSSKRYSSDARWALTIMTALTLSLGAAITIVVLNLRA